MVINECGGRWWEKARREWNEEKRGEGEKSDESTASCCGEGSAGQRAPKTASDVVAAAAARQRPETAAARTKAFINCRGGQRENDRVRLVRLSSVADDAERSTAAMIESDGASAEQQTTEQQQLSSKTQVDFPLSFFLPLALALSVLKVLIERDIRAPRASQMPFSPFLPMRAKSEETSNNDKVATTLDNPYRKRRAPTRRRGEGVEAAGGGPTTKTPAWEEKENKGRGEKRRGRSASSARTGQDRTGRRTFTSSRRCR
jgi:hypothetical protein